MSEEDVCLLTARASFQHGGQELGGPPGTEGLHLEKAVHLLVICQLVDIEEPGLDVLNLASAKLNQLAGLSFQKESSFKSRKQGGVPNCMRSSSMFGCVLCKKRRSHHCEGQNMWAARIRLIYFTSKSRAFIYNILEDFRD